MPRLDPPLAVVVVSHNRPHRLAPLLAHLAATSTTRHAEVIIVDNASAPPVSLPLHRPPHTQLLRLDTNTGVDAFNAGARLASASILLILDDDALPDPASLDLALHAILADPTIGAIGLTPIQKSSGHAEWSFPKHHTSLAPWPLLGCANLVRRSAWIDAHGYDPAFFLYSNDSDLALKLLGRGWSVLANPDWFAIHDCPSSFHRPPHWFKLAARNRAWTARRHAPKPLGLLFALGASLDVLRRALANPASLPKNLTSALAGAAKGLLLPYPPLPSPHPAGSRALRTLAFAGFASSHPSIQSPRPAPPPPPQKPTQPISRITAIIPAHNRPEDLHALLSDLASLHRPELNILVIDNASTPPLDPPPFAGPSPVRLIRLSTNTGGAGGFNAGLAAALQQSPAPGALWLLDSDVRLLGDPLSPLLAALNRHNALAAVGSALRDPVSGHTYEIGGRIHRSLGMLVPAADQDSPPIGPVASGFVPCDYLAACSLLVRTSAAVSAGPFPDTFLLYDDVLWTSRLQTPSTSIAALRSSVVNHPWRKASTWSRYYRARNALTALSQLGLPRRALLARALIESALATALAAAGRQDLADLHILGLRHALNGQFIKDPRLLPPSKPLDVRSFDSLPQWMPPPRSCSADLRPHLRHRSGQGLPRSGINISECDPPRSTAARSARALGSLALRLVGLSRARGIVAPLGSPIAWIESRRWAAVTGDGYIPLETSLTRDRLRPLRTALTGAALGLRLALAPRLAAAPKRLRTARD
jgi:GT2 family glycosyltransferase